MLCENVDVGVGKETQRTKKREDLTGIQRISGQTTDSGHSPSKNKGGDEGTLKRPSDENRFEGV